MSDMSARELAAEMVKRYEHVLRTVTDPRSRYYMDPFDNGMHHVVAEAVKSAFGFDDAEAAKYIKIVIGEV